MAKADHGSLQRDLLFPPNQEAAAVARSGGPRDGADGTGPRRFRHPVWYHPDTSDRLDEWPHLLKRLGIVLQHLAAHGRTSVVKGCRGNENRGWRRTPLGGARGMQFYLWWAPRGSVQTETLNLPENAVAVRTIRHHDDHRQLAAGASDDYLPLQAAPDLGEHIAEDPWTDEQTSFARSRSRVRLLNGRPGTGKTTALWRAIEAQAGEKVLYLTWSRELRRQAEERFASFAPRTVDVDTIDFETFLGEISGEDVPRLTLAASRARLAALIGRLSAKQLGPWARQRDALHGELRSFLYGRAHPGTRRRSNSAPIRRLSDEEYEKIRGGHRGIGVRPAQTLLKVARRFPEDVSEVFPELAAATQALDRLRSGRLPAGFDEYDRIVVDEVQDLTLLEASVVVELYLASAKRTSGRGRGTQPWLMLAGDEGQTVRPTGFEWGPLRDLLTKRTGGHGFYELGENLRSPNRIAEVIRRVSTRYADLPRPSRPGRQHRHTVGRHVEAGLFHVAVAQPAEAIELLEALDNANDAVVVAPAEEPPHWVPDSLRPMVLTPAQAKGLEYQAVCVLDPGATLGELAEAKDRHFEVERQALRATLDSLQVAISRATETLAFIDVEAPVEHLALSREALNSAAPYDWKDLRDHLLDPDAPPEERVLARTNDARALIDSAPERAWQRARQAVRLLGDPELPNAVSDTAIRLETRTTLLATAARLFVDGLPRNLDGLDILDECIHTIMTLPPPRDPGADSAASPQKLEITALERLSDWCSSEPRIPPFDLLRAAQALRSDANGSSSWLKDALPPAAQAIRRGIDGAARNPESAVEFVEADVEAWLELAFFTGNATAKARRLRAAAFETLLKRPKNAFESSRERRSRLDDAELLYRAIAPDFPRLGRLREKQNRIEDAAKAYQRAGLDADILRLWRNQGDWERALPLADEKTKADLSWLLELEDFVERRPNGQNRRLREAEKARLEKLLDKVQRRPPRTAPAARRR